MSLGKCFKKIAPIKLARLLDKLIASKFALFSVSGLKIEIQKVDKRRTYIKLKHANSITVF